jgi:hypothetical protein
MSLFLQAIMLSGWAMVSQLTHSDKHNDELTLTRHFPASTGQLKVALADQSV